jgi:hypothetical protein
VISRRLAVTAAIVVAAAGAATAVVEASGMAERIPAGVRVDGVPVGGLSPTEAAQRVEAYARQAAVRRIVVQGPERTVTTSGTELRARARVSEALDAARAGRVGPIRHWFGRGESRKLVLRYDMPPASVETLAQRLGVAAPVDAAVTVDAADVHVREAQAGRIVNARALALRLSTLPRRVIVPTLASAPRITTSEAVTAASRARRLTDHPRELLIGSDSHTLAPRDLRSLLLITRAEDGFRIEFDADRLRRLLPPASEPRDAALAIEGERVRIVPARPGLTVDPEATSVALADSSQRTVQAAVAVVPPRVTTSELAVLGIREQISTFTTFYPPGQPRVINIKRASSVIDGTILRPGATFSMNQVLGERTVEKGYVAAPQIVGSSFADSVGGGISQVATMLYNGAFFAGLELIEHQPHSLYIERYPLGREATISWGGPELIFRNDWPAAVLIKLEAGMDSITVRFFSSKLERRVETETHTPFGHGGGGFTVDYTRHVYKGSTLIRDERYRVRYGVATSHGR